MTMPIAKPVSGVFIKGADGVFLSGQSKRLQHWSLSRQDILFGHIAVSFDAIPNWHKSVFTNLQVENNQEHWSIISDFDSGAGDIKGVWELSRFTWLIPMAQNYVKTSDIEYLETCNDWIANWSQHNPANQGPNWKCAQEASFRVLHLAAAAMISGNTTPSEAAAEFVEQHINRILPTLDYAKAQDNNHGTSEAAALYVGATWLLNLKSNASAYRKVQKGALRYLHERVSHLILEDGSFSQYSLTYHRLMLDTLCLVELWRRFSNQTAFSMNYQDSLGRAATWLFEMTDPVTGNGPNLGANDGAHVLNYFGAAYRDFRYTTELACLLFRRRCAYPGAISDTVRGRFLLTAIGEMPRENCIQFAAGGYGIARDHHSWLMLRVPNYQFRPGHADALHLDLWVKGENVLRDGGSFSYNTEPEWLAYFSESASHNVVEFDGLPQMPKLSRFLFGAWPQYDRFVVTQQDADKTVLEGAFTLWHGARHHRTVLFTSDQVTVIDKVINVKNRASLHWRLAPGSWQKHGNVVSRDQLEIAVTCNKSIAEIALVQGYESIYYGQKEPIPVLELAVSTDATITTIIRWN